MERMLDMEKTLQELADLLQGKILQGDPAMVIKGVNGLEEARPDQISFAVPPYLEIAGQSHAGAIMIPGRGEPEGESGSPLCGKSPGCLCPSAAAVPPA
jgi:UDP-3-O-[3-hydroxymyristoyl] glucosamine N-acyltransferase